MDSNQKFHNFMTGFTAAVELDKRAAKEGCFVECVVLSAAVIDGTLRMGLILKHQLETNSKDLIDELLYQEEDGKGISEREIYRRALAKNIITQETHDSLSALYARRNRVIHRYIISMITTKDVLDIACEYDSLKHEVSDYVAELEKEQIRLGIGMTVSGDSENLSETLEEIAIAKHGDDDLAEALRNGI
jgi:uncharacterized protein YutE (UPF0331/DUF86 family)